MFSKKHVGCCASLHTGVLSYISKHCVCAFTQEPRRLVLKVSALDTKLKVSNAPLQMSMFGYLSS